MDETWGSFLSVVAQFIQGGEPKNVQVKDGYCFVPPELGVGAFELCLRGDDGESVVASVNRLTLEVCEGFDPSGEPPLPPSPDLYTQPIKEIDSGKKIAQSVREDADSGKFNGPPGPPGPALAVTNTATVGQTIKVAAVDENGKPTEWEAVNMPEQVQPDWNQNDSTAANYVKNRPFYDNLLVRVPIPRIPGIAFYKVSDSVPTGDCSDGASATIIVAGKKELLSISNPGYDYYFASEFVVVALEDNVTVTEFGLTLPGKGTYFVAGNEVPLITGLALGADADPEITWDGNIGELKKLDEKYFPENVATKSDVEVAQAAADKNKEVLDGVFSSVATFTFDKQTEGRDTFGFNAFNYYKISDFNPSPSDVISFKGTRASGLQYSTITAGNNCTSYGFFIVVASAGNCSIPITDTVTGSFIAPSAGLYAR